MKMYIIPLFYLYVAIFWYATYSNSVTIKKWCLCPIFCEIAQYVQFKLPPFTKYIFHAVEWDSYVRFAPFCGAMPRATQHV